MRKKPRTATRSTSPNIAWSARSLRDLEAIEQFIAHDDPVAATRWVMKLITTAERAAKLPTAGRVVPEKRRDDIREVRLKTYRLVYAVHERGITVLTVFEGHKLFADE
jgi:plasmid stabilization system protein ParE